MPNEATVLFEYSESYTSGHFAACTMLFLLRGKELKMDKKMPLERFQRTYSLPVCAWEENRVLRQGV